MRLGGPPPRGRREKSALELASSARAPCDTTRQARAARLDQLRGVIIGSGNLTKPGYRENLEVFGRLDTGREQAGHRAAILESITFLERVTDRALGDEARPGPKRSLRDTLAAARDSLQNWPHEEPGRARVAPIFGGVGPSIFDQLRERRPAGGPPRYAHVVSPFFDADPPTAAVVPALVEGLAKSGDRGCFFYIAAEPQADGKIRLFAPPGLIEAVRKHAPTFVYGLPLVQDGEPRKLHSKMLALANDEWQLLLIGSSNFTRAGLGIAAGAANLEANLAYLTRTNEPEYRALESVWPDVGDEVDLNSSAIVWLRPSTKIARKSEHRLSPRRSAKPCSTEAPRRHGSSCRWANICHRDGPSKRGMARACCAPRDGRDKRATCLFPGPAIHPSFSASPGERRGTRRTGRSMSSIQAPCRRPTSSGT